jgi:hypothetical protein
MTSCYESINYLCSDEIFKGSVDDITNAVVKLYSKDNYCGESVDVPADKNIDNFNAYSRWAVKFGDKTRSVQWLIPEGWSLALYDDDEHKDTKFLLDGNGKPQGIKSLKDFAEKASSSRWEVSSRSDITKPEESWVILYDDVGMKDRQLTINFKKDIPDFNHVTSDDDEQGFDDKPSSAKYQIAPGWKAVLYDDNSCDGNKITFEGDGKYHEIEKIQGVKGSSLCWERSSNPGSSVPIIDIKDSWVTLYDDDNYSDRKVEFTFEL